MNTIVVDDRQLAVNAMLQIMKEIDPEGSHAGLIDAEEAISYVKDHHPDVAFLDVEMPGMNGLELAEKMQQLHSAINIVFVTGHVEYAFDAHKVFASGYLVKPATREEVEQVLANLRHPLIQSQPDIFVRCFGNFEVFVRGEPVVFRRTKSKELFAYLVDNNGARVSMGELLSCLWEDGENSTSRNSQLRMFISDVRKTFEDLGFADVIVKEYNAVAVRTEMLSCDYFDFLNGDANAANAWRGEYMRQYSWGEMRIPEIMRQIGG